MYMQRHNLTALREEFDQWENVLARLSEGQIAAPHFGSFTVKDIVAHLWAWQQITLARVEAAGHNREPEFPVWVAGLPADWEDEADRTTDLTNARIRELNRDRPWPDVHAEWRAGFSRLLELGEALPERVLLDSNRYPWLKGHSLAVVLLGTYDHHHEHLEKLLDWLRERGDRPALDSSFPDTERKTP
jgi:hypothetical protein